MQIKPEEIDILLKGGGALDISSVRKKPKVPPQIACHLSVTLQGLALLPAKDLHTLRWHAAGWLGLLHSHAAAYRHRNVCSVLDHWPSAVCHPSTPSAHPGAQAYHSR